MRTLLLFAGCMLCSVAAVAQVISGKVTTVAGAAIAGASVHLLNTDRSAVTGSTGNFTLHVPAAGVYQLQVQATGYAAAQYPVVANVPVQVQLSTVTRQLDAVVVTAGKQEAALQQLPFTVTGITAQQVKAWRLWDVKDVTAIAPNTYAADAGDNRNVTGIRGIVTTSYDQAVATYIDGVNQFGLDTYIASLVDVERIEILRGAQGTLYGRNAMGGVVNIITKQPTDQPEAFADLDAGNAGLQRYTIGARIPLVKHKLYLGAAAQYSASGGFYTNTYTNSKYDRQHRITGNYYLRYQPGNNWRVQLNVKHSNGRNKGAFPLAPDATSALAHPFVISQDANGTMVDNTINTSLVVQHSSSGIQFTSQTAWQKNYRYYANPVDGDFSPLDAVSVINNYGKHWNKVNVYTQEFRFSSPAGNTSALQWSAGAYGFYQDAPVKQATRYGAAAALLGVGDSLFTTRNTTNTYNAGAALYGDVTYRLTPALSVTGGLRYDAARQHKRVLGEYRHDPPTDWMTSFADTAAMVTYHAFSPRLSLGYTFSEQLFGYLNYSQGFRTGGLTDLSGDPSQPPLYAYQPEHSHNYEAGVRQQLFNRSWQVRLAAFYTTLSHAQVPTLLMPEAVTIIRNTGTLHTRGAEAEIAGLPLPCLQLQWSAGYTHARYQAYKTTQNGEPVDLSGRAQVFTPAVTSMLALQYTHTFKGKQPLQVMARGEWRYLGNTYFDIANTIQQPAYSLFNLRAGIQAGKYALWGWTRNVLNKKYISYAYDFGAAKLGDPATYGVTLEVRIR
ncbi:TonB-dependent receptor [Deminuibacter soli]|nr:TonB-dependent receptor [Deminuibacter soli]